MRMKHYMKALRTIQEKEDVERKLKIIKSRAESLIEYIDDIKLPTYTGWFALFDDDETDSSGFKFIGFFNSDKVSENDEPNWKYAVPMASKETFPEFLGW